MDSQASGYKKFFLGLFFIILFQLGSTFLYMSSAPFFDNSNKLDFSSLIFGIIFVVLAHKVSVKRLFSWFAFVFLLCVILSLCHNLLEYQWIPGRFYDFFTELTRLLHGVNTPLIWAVLFYAISREEAKKMALVWIFLSGAIIGFVPYLMYIPQSSEMTFAGMRLDAIYSLIAFVIMSLAWFFSSKITIKQHVGLNKAPFWWGIVLLVVFMLITALDENCALTMKNLMRSSVQDAQEYMQLMNIYSKSVAILMVTISILIFVLSLFLLQRKGLSYTILFGLLVIGIIPIGEYVYLYFSKEVNITHYFLLGATIPTIKYYLFVLLLMNAFSFPASARLQAFSYLVFLPFLKNFTPVLGGMGFFYPGSISSMKTFALTQGGGFVILWALTLFFAHKLCKAKFDDEHLQLT